MIIRTEMSIRVPEDRAADCKTLFMCVAVVPGVKDKTASTSVHSRWLTAGAEVTRLCSLLGDLDSAGAAPARKCISFASERF